MEYFEPKTLCDALSLLAKHGAAAGETAIFSAAILAVSCMPMDSNRQGEVRLDVNEIATNEGL
jgi:hypothetical protein